MFKLNFTQMRKKLLLPFTHWRKAQRVLLLLVGVLGVILPASAQTPVYSNDFSSPELFSAMTVIDANNDGSTWTRNNGGYAQYTYNSNNAANDWLITPGITLQAGKTYQFDIDAWARSTSYKERLEVKMGTAANASGMTTSVIASTEITSTSQVTLTNNTVTVASTGVYYFGIHAISDKDRWQLYVDNLVITNLTPETCTKPTNLTASNVVYNGATLTWTPGDAEQDAWQIVYGTGNFDLDAATPIDVSGTPTYTITGLEPDATYNAYVRGYCSADDVSAWSQVCTFTTPERYVKPTNLTISDITAHSASASWTGNDDAQSYNLRFREIVKGIVSDFEDSSFGEWTTIDADGDGFDWVLGSAVGGIYLAAGSSLAGSGHSPQDLIVSGSYSNLSGALTPDNYLVSPKVALGGSISFYAKGQDSNYAAEVFGVAVSTTGNTNVADFTMVGTNKTATGDWVQYTFDLSAYAGQEGYVAIRHYNCTDQFMLDIDDIIISSPQSEGNWLVFNNIDATSYNITGLSPETEYEVQVQAVYADGTSDWTNSVNFTTLSANAMPTNLTVTDVTDCTATASWNGSQDNYNLRYRKMTFFESFETFPGNWTIIDSDGDGHTWSQVDLTTQFSGNYTAVDGSNVVMSRSWINSSVGAVTPDQGLISPQVELGGILKYFVMDEYGYPETYRIYVSTNGTDISDFQPLTDDLLTPNTNKWTECTVDLSAYNGQTGHIAFHHYNCYDKSFMFIDAVSIGDNWTTVNSVTSPNTITGLEAESDYEVEVQGVLDNETTTDWTLPTYFTTLEAVSRPMTLAALVADGEVGIRYTISEPLLVVRSNGNSIWLKDADGSSILKTSPAEGYQNYAIVWEGNPHENQADYDQSNWIEVQLADGSEDVVNLVGNRIKADKITGTFSNKTNPTMTGVTLVEGDYEITAGEDEYMLNYYCTANFDGSQPATIGTGAGTNYFFMNPKPQECAFIIWAKYDAASGKMIMPSTSEGNGHGFHGEFEVDLSLNIGTPPEDGKTYNFDAIVRMIEPTGGNMLRENNSNGYIVYPLNLSEPVVTGINDVTGKAVAGVKYYNVAGIESDRPFDGVNIIVTTYTDGSRSSAKVLK